MNSNSKLLLNGVMLTVLAGGVTSNLYAQCGVERWSVKTGTDANARLVNLNSAIPTTIGSLRALPTPKTLPASTRIQPTETTVFTLNATLVEFALENDSDYHVVIADANGNTMITEIPAPKCVGAASPFASDISAARAAFDGRFVVTTSFQKANIPVQITGVGFFDSLHGQAGVAPNGIELHPVLDIKIGNAPGTSADFTLSASAALNIATGSSGTTTIFAMPSNGFNATLTLSASGLPSGATAHFTGSPIPGGSGSSNLTVTAGANVAPGNYTVAVKATGGALTHILNVPLTVHR
jgi:hypothetical protein